MKPVYSIIPAAAAVVAMLIRQVLGGEPAPAEPTGASPIPPITPRLVERLALAGSTDAEIADRFLLDESTIRNDFKDVLTAARSLRRMSIRSMQFEAAKKLNGPMLTWLGRNELGQSLSPSASDEDEPSYAPGQLS